MYLWHSSTEPFHFLYETKLFIVSTLTPMVQDFHIIYGSSLCLLYSILTFLHIFTFLPNYNMIIFIVSSFDAYDSKCSHYLWLLFMLALQHFHISSHFHIFCKKTMILIYLLWLPLTPMIFTLFMDFPCSSTFSHFFTVFTFYR